MADYVLLYSGGSGMAASVEEQAASIQAWGAWYTGLGDAVKDPGNPFSGAANGIDSDGSVSAGAGAMPASGYSIIKADSLDAATEMAQGCPVLKDGGKIMVYETFAIM